MTGDSSKKNENVAKEGGLTMNFQYPMLNSTNYTIWAVKIRALFNVHGIWEVIEPTQGTEVDKKKDNSAIAMLYQAIPESMVLQVANLNSAKEIWDALKIRHVGVDRVKEARVQTLESEFEQLKMKDGESLDVYAGKISEVASQASNLGHTVEDKRMVRKLLSSVPEKFMQIVAAIEQFADLNTMPFQEAIGRLKAFEERTKKAVKEEDGSSSLLFSNVDEKTKEHKCEHCGHVNSSQERTERGRGKNWKPWKKKDGDQDKSQIRCYKCKELGHYKSECPKWEKEHEANLIQEDDEPTLL